MIVLVVALAQLLLPGIAAQRLRDRLSRSGQVIGVEVHAFPALELLWHHADRVVIRMASFRGSEADLATRLDQAAGVDRLEASADQVSAGLLQLRHASLSKRGDQITGQASVTEDDLRAAVPFLQAVSPVAAGNGQLVLRGTASLLGVSATADATVTATSGQIQVTPQVPFGSLATVTVFSDPRLTVEGLSAAPAPDGFTVSATGRLR